MICDKPRDRISLQSARVKMRVGRVKMELWRSVTNLWGEDWAMQGQQRVKNSKVQSTANAALQRWNLCRTKCPKDDISFDKTFQIGRNPSQAPALGWVKTYCCAHIHPAMPLYTNIMGVLLAWKNGKSFVRKCQIKISNIFTWGDLIWNNPFHSSLLKLIFWGVLGTIFSLDQSRF